MARAAERIRAAEGRATAAAVAGDVRSPGIMCPQRREALLPCRDTRRLPLRMATMAGTQAVAAVAAEAVAGVVAVLMAVVADTAGVATAVVRTEPSDPSPGRFGSTAVGAGCRCAGLPLLSRGKT